VPTPNRPLRAAVILFAALVPAFVACAQFDSSNPGLVRERIGGTAFPGLSASTIEAGDQLGAFFGEQLVGSFAFTSGTGPEFSLIISGDNPATQASEGPDTGEQVEIRFYDASTNFVLNNIRVETAGGERFNLTFQGQAVPNIPGLPIDLTPSRLLNVRITEGGGAGGPSGPGGGGGGDPGNPGQGFDVNGDGTVDRKDIALVIRAITASNINTSSAAGQSLRARFVTEQQLRAADVNGDGIVSSQDITTILRGIRIASRPAVPTRPTNIQPTN